MKIKFRFYVLKVIDISLDLLELFKQGTVINDYIFVAYMNKMCKFLTKFKLSNNILCCALADNAELELLSCMSAVNS